MPRAPEDVPAGAVAAVMAFCSRTGRAASEPEVRGALAALSPAEERQVLELAAAPYAGPPLGPRALVGMALDALEERRRREAASPSSAAPPAPADGASPAPREPPSPEPQPAPAPPSGEEPARLPRRRRLPLVAPAELAAPAAERHRALREARQRQVLDLFAKHKAPEKVARELGLTLAELDALVDKLSLRRRLRAMARGELVEYPPLRPRGVEVRPVQPLRRKAAPGPAVAEAAPAPPQPMNPRVREQQARLLLKQLERTRGDRGRVAKMLGTTVPALEDRINALGIGLAVHRLRDRERKRELRADSLANRIEQALSRSAYLEDLGILWKIDRDLGQKLSALYKEIAAHAPSERAAQAELKARLGLTETQVRRLVQRYLIR